MEILEILKNSGDDIIPEDLELFRTELIVGEYSEDYKAACLELIAEIEKWNCSGKSVSNNEKDAVSAMQMDINDLKPNKNISFPEQFKKDLNIMRISSTYKSRFKAYIKEHDEFDESFVDSHFSMFEQWEIDAIISEMPLSEAFIEKYFAVLDKDKIARYQLFSESFYQKHFSDFDTDTVLKKGRNEWRKKENRSKQLDVFLRLKGVKE